jgi:regulator of protease activity HflC (stomatin/prohibitin superfamily)
VLNAERASRHCRLIFAITQLAQTASAAGSARSISTRRRRAGPHQHAGGQELDSVRAWGVKVLRYEIKNITPPHDVLAAMEKKQMRQSREKSAP